MKAQFIEPFDLDPTEHLGRVVRYRCYPHLNQWGGEWIRGHICSEFTPCESEIFFVIRTHDDDMKHPSLEGCADYILPEMTEDMVLLPICGGGYSTD